MQERSAQHLHDPTTASRDKPALTGIGYPKPIGQINQETIIENLNTYAAIADIIGALTIFSGTFFAVFQMLEFRRGRRYQAAADLCKEFTKPDMAQSVTLLKSLPDGLSSADIQARGSEYEEAALTIGMTFETMGLLVHKDIASFRTVQELTGSLLLMMWRKIERSVQNTRDEQNTQRFGEWVQWLAERIDECESDLEPPAQTALPDQLMAARHHDQQRDQ